MLKFNPLTAVTRGLKKRVLAALILAILPGFSPVPGMVVNRAGAQTIDKITTTPKVYSLNPCETKEFQAAVKGTDGKTIKDAKVSWESTNPSVATVDSNGLVMGRTPGYTFIRPKSGKVKGEAASLFVRNKGVTPNC